MSAHRAGHRRRVAVSLLAGLTALALLGWPAWNVAQARLAVTGSLAARTVVAGCNGVSGWTFVYRVALVGRHGALCSALLHQPTFWSSITGREVPDHWVRLDCVVLQARGAPYCSMHTLAGATEWLDLAGPPAPEITDLVTAGVR